MSKIKSKNQIKYEKRLKINLEKLKEEETFPYFIKQDKDKIGKLYQLMVYENYDFFNNVVRYEIKYYYFMAKNKIDSMFDSGRPLFEYQLFFNKKLNYGFTTGNYIIKVNDLDGKTEGIIAYEIYLTNLNKKYFIAPKDLKPI